jgi:hypothetical protein
MRQRIEKWWPLWLCAAIVSLYLLVIFGDRGQSALHWFTSGPHSDLCAYRKLSNELNSDFIKIVLALSSSAIALQVAFREKVLGEVDGQLAVPLYFRSSAVLFLMASFFAAIYLGVGANIVREVCTPRWNPAREIQVVALKRLCEAAESGDAVAAEEARKLLATQQDWAKQLEIVDSGDMSRAMNTPIAVRGADLKAGHVPCSKNALRNIRFGMPRDTKLMYEVSTARTTFFASILMFSLGCIVMVLLRLNFQVQRPHIQALPCPEPITT